MSTDDDKPEENDPRNPIETMLGVLSPMLGPMMGNAVLAVQIKRLKPALTRIADALELQAILQTQISVPDHISARLDAWRDDILGRMTRRYKARLDRQDRRREAKKEDPGVGPTHPGMKGEPAEGTFYGEPIEKVMGQATQTDRAGDPPDDASGPASRASATTDPAPGDSHPPRAGAVDTPRH